MQPLSVCLQLDKICVRRNATGPNNSANSAYNICESVHSQSLVQLKSRRMNLIQNKSHANHG